MKGSLSQPPSGQQLPATTKKNQRDGLSIGTRTPLEALTLLEKVGEVTLATKSEGLRVEILSQGK